ncbi:MAG: phage protease [Hungatella sp.]|jgi:phage I-like protein|nr:phage protease [Hungatella sp.]
MDGFIICKGGEAQLEGVPEVVKLLPLGHVKSQKGDFDVDKESFAEIRRHFEERGIDIVIDYEHQTLKDIQAPAGGWIKDIILEDGAIAAKVEWTPTARKYLENKEYKYLSPVVLVRKADNKAMELHSAALTNSPAIDGMFAIVNSWSFENGGNNMELIKKLAALLGLGEDATEEQVLKQLETALKEAKDLKDAASGDKGAEEPEKVVANKVVCELLGLKGGAPTEDVTAKIMELKNGKTSGFNSEVEIKALKEQLAKRDADDAVLKALKAGKIAVPQKEWAEAYALKDPTGFAAFVEKAPQVVPIGEIEFDLKANKAEEKPDEETLFVCKQLGISEEDLKKYGYGKGVK